MIEKEENGEKLEPTPLKQALQVTDSQVKNTDLIIKNIDLESPMPSTN